MTDLAAATIRAIAVYGDGATATFYEKLRQRSFGSTQCADCGEIAFPPRLFCPACGSEAVQWVDLPRRGTLHAFSQQPRSLRFSAPDVLGLVELPDVGLVFTLIDAPLEDLAIGQPVELHFHAVSDDLIVHQFRPLPD